MISLELLNSDDIFEKLAKKLFFDTDIINECRNLHKKIKEGKNIIENNRRDINDMSEFFRTTKDQQIVLKIKDIKEANKKLEEDIIKKEKLFLELILKIPNVPCDIVPNGKSASDNEVVYQWGELLNKEVPHWDIVKKLDIVDFEIGNKITGSGFPLFKNRGASLQRALINFFLDQAIEEGYSEMQTPLLINKQSAYATTQLPDKEGQMYHIERDDFYLLPTGEVPLTNIYRDEIIEYEKLPVKLVGYTPCFRREAGTWGSHVRGLNRLHQFDKVEIVQIVEADKSHQVIEQMVEYVSNILKKLNIPFRILRLCGGDMSFSSSLTYDFEVWSSGQKRWLEVSSVSNFETFQSNRLKLRTKKSNKNELLHTLNGSALALPRVLAAIIENNYNNNKIIVPDILHPYLKFKEIYE